MILKKLQKRYLADFCDFVFLLNFSTQKWIDLHIRNELRNMAQLFNQNLLEHPVEHT